MIIPEAVREELEPVLGRVRRAVAVGGGCVSDTARVTADHGEAFLKHDLDAPPGMFAAEAEGLRELRDAGTQLRVPAVLGSGERWLALEWIDTAPATAPSDEALGRGLAELHGGSSGGWGWHRPGFIGTLPQANEPSAGWADFWASRRLEPQLRISHERGAEVGAAAEWARLFEALPAALAVADEEGDSLLHGDLWRGNALVTSLGEPALIDPAAYYGHREVDLAMADLFGGFDPRFREAYEQVRPLAPGYQEIRRGIYQLYYLLVHVNLFGGGYADRTRGVLVQVLRGL